MSPDVETNESPGLPEEEDYYAEVERHFVALRGSPLFITAKDWYVIHGWREKQIPLLIVKEGLDRAFEKRKSRRPVRQLSYCRQSVEAAYRRHREARLGGPSGEAPREEVESFRAQSSDLEKQLREISSKLKVTHPSLAEAAEQAAGRLSLLASELISATGFQEIEDELSLFDELLLAAAEAALGDGERKQCLDDANHSLAGYLSRMPDDVHRAAVRSAYLKRVRVRFGLPVLSLF